VRTVVLLCRVCSCVRSLFMTVTVCMRRISYAFRGDIYVLCLFFFVSLKEKEVLWSSLFEGDALSSLLLILSRCKGLHCLFRFVFTEV
jgi:hypothetical protein